MKIFSRSTRRRAGGVFLAARKLWIHVWRQLRYSGDLAAACRDQRGIMLNIGCGALVKDGWINADYDPIKGKSYYLDAIDPLPIADGTVRHIHCEHFIEHLEFRDAILFLAQANRVLEPGGTMRLIMPDAERYMRAYVSNDKEFFERLVNLGGHDTPLRPKNRVCNHMFRMWGDHQFAWDYETLESVAREAGFKIARSSHNDDPHSMDGQDWWRPFESLYANLSK